MKSGRFFCRSFRWLLVLSILLSGGAGFLWAEDVDERFYVNATFTTYDGRPLTNIRPEEVRITVDGEAVQVLKLIEPDEPFNIGLLMDVSPSKEGEVDGIRRATADFVSWFPLDNPIMILTFDSEIYVDCDWTTDRKKVDEAIWEYGLHKPGGSTILREAIVAAVEQKYDEKRPRTAMILFTDGVDTGSKAIDEDESVEFLRQAGVVPYVLQHFSIEHQMRVQNPSPENPDLSRMPSPRGTKMGPIFVGGRSSERDWAEYKVNQIHETAVSYLGKVSRAGGGMHIQMASVGELGKAYERVAAELTDVYTIYYAPPSRSLPGALRQVRVSCSRDDVTVRARPESFQQAK
ncbi:MAG: hypothetical protein JSU96_20125 [Acidobacteriota bacterium]|nr:MAG: hypothetical protein JSU96_20125 [Acidobacteriota bacterium]